MPQDATTRPKRGHAPRFQRWLLVMLLTALPLQLIPAMLRTSITSDEVSHLPAGYSYLRTQDFRMNVEHPPFVKELAALPIVFFRPGRIFESLEWAKSEQWGFGRLLLFGEGRSGELMLFLGRLPIVAISILLGWILWKWALEWYGFGGALLGLTLYVFSPNILAHSRLVTYDLAVTCFYFTAVYCFRRFLARPTWRFLLFCSIAAALASLSKYSGVLIYPTLLLLLVWSWGIRTFAFASLGKLATMPSSRLFLRYSSCTTSLVVLTFIFTWLFLTMGLYMSFNGPMMYWHGMSQIYANKNPYYLFYINGRFYGESVWYYPFFAIILKTPLPTLLCALLGVITLFLKRNYDQAGWLLIPALVFTLPTVLFSRNLGLRYLLPLYPYLFLSAASVWGALGRRAAGRWMVGLMVTASVLAALFSWPHHLAYFNSAARTKKVFHWLDDSNLDWGQGYIDLRAYLKSHGIERPIIRFFTSDPAFYGIDYVPFDEAMIARTDPGTYIVSTHLINREPSLYWLRNIEPVEVIAKTLHVYRLNSDAYQRAFEIYDQMIRSDEPNFLPEFGVATLHHRRGKLDLAEKWYEKAIEKAARSGVKVPSLLVKLGSVHFEKGDLVTAQRAFEESIELKPSFAAYHNLAVLALARGQDYNTALRYWQRGSRYAREKAELVLVNVKIGVVLLQLNSPSRAEPYFRRALAADPLSLDALIGLAESQQGIGRLSEAIRLYREALSRHPDNLALLNRLGLLLLQAGQTDEARAHWEEALRLSPGHPEATRLLQRLPSEPQ